MKKLFPLFLLILIAGAFGRSFLFSDDKEKEYNAYLAQADEAAKKEYYVEAVSYLQSAYRIIPSYNVLSRAADYYKIMEDYDNYGVVVQKAVASYPDEEDARVRLLEYYAQKQYYADLCRELKTAAADFPDSQAIRQIYNTMSQKYMDYNIKYSDIVYRNANAMDVANNQYISLGKAEAEKKSVLNLKNTAEKAAGNFDENTEKTAATMRQLLDSSGMELFNYPYKMVIPAEDGVTMLKQCENGSWELVNYSNQLLARNQEAKITELLGMSKEGVITGIADGKYALLNKKLQIVVDGFEGAAVFSEGVGAVEQGGKWALITVETCTDPVYQYDDIAQNRYNQCFKNGVAAVKTEGRWILVDLKGKQIGEESCDEIKAFESSQPTAFKRNGLYGFLSADGSVYMDPVYEDAMPFVNGYAPIKTEGKWNFINRYGERMLEDSYDDVLPVRENGRAFLLESDGMWRSIQFYMPYYTE